MIIVSGDNVHRIGPLNSRTTTQHLELKRGEVYAEVITELEVQDVVEGYVDTAVADKFSITTGHDHDGVDSKQITHNNLSGIGTLTHAQLDTHVAATNNPHTVTKSQIGLGDVDNTSDTAKPVSTAQNTINNALQANINAVLPIRSVIMWGGNIAQIPSNYALCDGRTVNGITTPDLSGRFIIGYDADTVATPINVTDSTKNYAAIGNTGGADAKTLTLENIPSHNHKEFAVYTQRGNANLRDNANQYVADWNHDSAGTNEYQYEMKGAGTTVATIGDTSYTGGVNGQVTSFDIRPMYCVLAYIMKVA